MGGVSEARSLASIQSYYSDFRLGCIMALMSAPDQTPISEQTVWVIKKSKISGRGLFATKQIKRGDLIFKNKPLIIGPRGDHARDSFCSTCYTIESNCTPCNTCSLLLCSQCTMNENHTKECDFIFGNWKLKPNCDKQPADLTRSLIYIRSLLLDEEEKHLLSIFQKNNDKFPVEELEALCNNYVITEEQVRFMKSVDSIFKSNAFRVAHDKNSKKVPLRGLYLISGLMNHSCLPNTRNVFCKNHNMAVYATRDIAEGEEILTCYTGLLWCTPARRCQLQKTKHFWCKCERCCDRTEKGTKLAAFKCLNKACIGVILPINPLDPISDWQCERCESSVATAKISALQSVLGSLLSTLDLENQFHLESLVVEKLPHVIPYTNHIFIDLGLRLAMKLGFAEELKLKELSESRLSLKESLCRGTLRTVAALGAGDAHLRGLLLYHLHAALAERARRCPSLYEVPTNQGLCPPGAESLCRGTLRTVTVLVAGDAHLPLAELKTEIECTIEQAFSILQGDISAPPDIELRYTYLGPGSDKPHRERFFILDG
ncbi:unnamed protein product [Chilo suppressalis]|uniref:SET domain-containing protein n=1 Tax=Chilo suppressalis TaxID=168631 RepID=A0ABN8B8T4_CHISP|nr:unnamed protein product [Chilo suppressalis]